MQTAASRPAVRQHGWHLWSAIWSPIPGGDARNDARQQRTNLFGTEACWSQFEDGTPACSGVYPLWMTWPNTGKPYPPSATRSSSEEESPEPASDSRVARRTGKTLRTHRSRAAPAAGGPADPTRVRTVNTSAPTYDLPPLAVSKQCGIDKGQVEQWLERKEYREIERACGHAGAPDVFCAPHDPDAPPAICDGTAFVNQGDVMIATESLSAEGYADIQEHALYEQASLRKLYEAREGSIASLIGPDFISTKHMFWPVKGCRPGSEVGSAGCRVRYGALPPWVPKDFRQHDWATNADYLGYEQWGRVVAIDTCQSASPTDACPPGNEAALVLQHVRGAGPIRTPHPEVYAATDFLHVQVSEEALERGFTAADRALLDQAMIWAYGDESNGFEAGDFLVVVAMHVNTKEIDSWTLQSVWWSPMTDSLTDCPLSEFNHCFGQRGAYAATDEDGSGPNPRSGLTSEQIAQLDARVGTTWRDHYLMTDSYGINHEIDGTPVKVDSYFEGTPPAWATTGPTGEPLPLLPISANVYIEPVIHPLGTNCQNCHRRAGYPGGSCDAEHYPGGCGEAGYQTAQCADLLGDYGAPRSSACMTAPWVHHDASGDHCVSVTDGTSCEGNQAYPILDTDLIWLIADGHVQQGR